MDIDKLTNESQKIILEARPLKRIITKEIETPVSRMLISGELKEDDKLNVEMKKGQLEFGIRDT